jgi:hypothetical protein
MPTHGTGPMYQNSIYIKSFPPPRCDGVRCERARCEERELRVIQLGSAG